MQYIILLLDPMDFRVVTSIGPFANADLAVDFAAESKACQKDYHWTLVTISPDDPYDEMEAEAEEAETWGPGGAFS